MDKQTDQLNGPVPPRGAGVPTIWVVIGLLALFIFAFFWFVQAITGPWGRLPPDGKPDVSQWCREGKPKRVERPVFTSDDKKFVLTLDGACSIGVYDLGTESMLLIKPAKGMAAYHATIGAQSDTVAFVLARQVSPGIIDYQLATSRMDGTGLSVLTSSDTRKWSPSYSPDGKKIIFVGSQHCRPKSASHCWQDIYELDLESNTEKRISHWNASQVGRAYLLPVPESNKLVASIYGPLHPEGAPAIPVEAKHGHDRAIFIINTSDPAQYKQLALDTPTASSPQLLPTGEIAFDSRVNEYENSKKNSYIHDVFLWSATGTKRLTHAKGFLRDFAVSNSAKSVLLLGTDIDDRSSPCDLLLWDVSMGEGRQLKCDLNAKELPLTP